MNNLAVLKLQLSISSTLNFKENIIFSWYITLGFIMA